jgi:hypothetical protein
MVVGLVLVASVVPAVGCGSGSPTASDPDGASTTTSTAPPVTTPARPDLVSALTQPGDHELPAPPLSGRYGFDYFQAGDQVLAWGASRSSGPADWGNYEPIDQGALLDPTTMSWTVLPPIGFPFPTSNAHPIFVGGRIVVVGNSCDVSDHQTVGTGVANCNPGPVQGATYDRRAQQWRPIPTPAEFAGFVNKVLPVGDRLLVDLLPAKTGVDRFGLLDPGAGTWRTVAPPTTGKPDVVCQSHGIAFAVNIRVQHPSGEWIELEDTQSFGGPDMYGQVQVSTLGPDDTAWSAPNQPSDNAPTSSVVTGCVGGGVLDGATGLPNGRLGGTVLFAEPNQPWTSTAPLPADFEPLGIGNSAMVTVLSGDRLAIDGQFGRREVFDGATRTWSNSPLALGAMGIDVTLGPAHLARNYDTGGLVAVTP